MDMSMFIWPEIKTISLLELRLVLKESFPSKSLGDNKEGMSKIPRQ